MGVEQQRFNVFLQTMMSFPDEQSVNSLHLPRPSGAVLCSTEAMPLSLIKVIGSSIASHSAAE